MNVYTRNSHEIVSFDIAIEWNDSRYASCASVSGKG